ncbi:hypothetical protein ACFQYP_64930 [Nonomuraea antimicrobica]
MVECNDLPAPYQFSYSRYDDDSGSLVAIHIRRGYDRVIVACHAAQNRPADEQQAIWAALGFAYSDPLTAASRALDRARD